MCGSTTSSTSSKSAQGVQTTSACPHQVRRLIAAHGKNGEAEGRPSTESATAGTLDEESLRRELEKAIQDEDYARAAALRDELRVVHRTAGRRSWRRTPGSTRRSRTAPSWRCTRPAWAKGDHVYVVHPWLF